MQVDQTASVDTSISVHLFSAEGLVAEVDDRGEVLFFTDRAGVLVEEEAPGTYCLHDVRYMDDGDDHGVAVGIAHSIAEAAEAARCWQSTAHLFPLPLRRGTFRLLMDLWRAARSNADDAAGAGAAAGTGHSAEALKEA